MCSSKECHLHIKAAFNHIDFPWDWLKPSKRSFLGVSIVNFHHCFDRASDVLHIHRVEREKFIESIKSDSTYVRETTVLPLSDDQMFDTGCEFWHRQPA